MARQVKLKTHKNKASVCAYINALEPATRRRQANTLRKLFTDVTATEPRMWGSSIVGYGEYTYYRANGAEGRYMATGFAMRKSGPTIYIVPGYKNYGALMDKLGPYKLGKSCLYLKSLDDIDLKILARIIKSGLRDLAKTHTVTMG